MIRIKKSYLIAIFLVLAGFLLVSCKLTEKLWYGDSYEDIVRSFLVASNGSQVVFIGEKYHYIFTDQSNLIKHLLLWPERKSIYIDLENSRIELDKLNNIKGYVVVRAIYSDPEVQKYRFY